MFGPRSTKIGPHVIPLTTAYVAEFDTVPRRAFRRTNGFQAQAWSHRTRRPGEPRPIYPHYIHMFGRFFQYLSGSGGRDAAIGGVSGPLVRRHTSVLGGTQRYAHTHIVATVLRRRVATTGSVGRRADCTPSRPYPGSLCSVLSRPRVTRVRYRASRADRCVWPKKERRTTLIHRGDEKYSSHGLLSVSRERTCHAGLPRVRGLRGSALRALEFWKLGGWQWTGRKIRCQQFSGGEQNGCSVSIVLFLGLQRLDLGVRRPGQEYERWNDAWARW